MANKYADILSRRFPRGDLQIRKHLWRSIADIMSASIDAFKLRPLGEHLSFMRPAVFEEPDRYWGKYEVILICPPVDLIGPTMAKLI